MSPKGFSGSLMSNANDHRKGIANHIHFYAKTSKKLSQNLSGFNYYTMVYVKHRMMMEVCRVRPSARERRDLPPIPYLLCSNSYRTWFGNIRIWCVYKTISNTMCICFQLPDNAHWTHLQWTRLLLMRFTADRNINNNTTHCITAHECCASGFWHPFFPPILKCPPRAQCAWIHGFITSVLCCRTRIVMFSVCLCLDAVSSELLEAWILDNCIRLPVGMCVHVCVV